MSAIISTSSTRIADTVQSTNPARYTVALFWRPDAAAVGSQIRFIAGWSTGGIEANFCWDHTDSSYQQCFYHAASYQPLKFATTLAGGVLYHICVTFDGSTMRLYLNGALNNSRSAAACAVSSTTKWAFGQTAGGQGGAAGSGSHLCAYDIALPPSDVLRLANREIPLSIQRGHLIRYNPLDVGAKPVVGPKVEFNDVPLWGSHPVVRTIRRARVIATPAAPGGVFAPYYYREHIARAG